MAPTPERELRACMQVMYQAAIDARASGWQDNVNPEWLADLMDAIHNIPFLIQNWESCDQELLKSSFLDFERKWKSDGPCLRTIYEQALANDR